MKASYICRICETPDISGYAVHKKRTDGPQPDVFSFCSEHKKKLASENGGFIFLELNDNEDY